MRRPTTVELMLLATVLLWALNLSVTKYVLEHGLLPLPYATVRYALAGLIFVGLTLYAERTLRVRRRDLPLLALAAGTLALNQLAFVFALDATTASTIGLVLGAIPIFAGLFGLALGTERPTGGFWLAAIVSTVGIGLVAAGSGGALSTDLLGILLGVATAATWAAYSVVVAPLMRTYSPSRMSSLLGLRSHRARHPVALMTLDHCRAAAGVLTTRGDQEESGNATHAVVLREGEVHRLHAVLVGALASPGVHRRVDPCTSVRRPD